MLVDQSRAEHVLSCVACYIRSRDKVRQTRTKLDVGLVVHAETDTEIEGETGRVILVRALPAASCRHV